MGILTFENVHKSFGQGTNANHVLKDINLDVQRVAA